LNRLEIQLIWRDKKLMDANESLTFIYKNKKMVGLGFR
jgi:hypothetical protein